MIQINLLPQRYRQVESTPAKIGIALVAGLILVLGSLVALGFFYLAKNSLVSQVESLNTDISGAEKQIASLSKIESEWAKQEKRKDTVKKLFLSRLIMAPKLARLQELVPQEIQITQLAFATAAKRDKKGAATLERSITLDGLVRVPRNDEQFFQDKQRMAILSAFVKRLQGDDQFYAGCTGDIDYVKPVTKEFINEAFFFPGETEPAEEHPTPVFSFGIKAVSDSSEAAGK